MRARNNSSQNSSYGPRGYGAEIAYVATDSTLGRLLVAGTRRGNTWPRSVIPMMLLASWQHYPLATIRVLASRIDARICASANGPMRSRTT